VPVQARENTTMETSLKAASVITRKRITQAVAAAVLSLTLAVVVPTAAAAESDTARPTAGSTYTSSVVSDVTPQGDQCCFETWIGCFLTGVQGVISGLFSVFECHKLPLVPLWVLVYE
jgi:hypothetical protein